MSLSSGPINEAEQAGEKLADHVLGEFEQVPGLFRRLLDVLCEYKFVVGLEKRQ